MEIAKNRTPVGEIFRFRELLQEFIKGYADKVYPMQQLMRHKGKKFKWNNAAEESFQRIKKNLYEKPELGMPTEKGNVRAGHGCISGILHQEQEWVKERQS